MWVAAADLVGYLSSLNEVLIGDISVSYTKNVFLFLFSCCLFFDSAFFIISLDL